MLGLKAKVEEEEGKRREVEGKLSGMKAAEGSRMVGGGGVLVMLTSDNLVLFSCVCYYMVKIWFVFLCRVLSSVLCTTLYAYLRHEKQLLVAIFIFLLFLVQ